MSNIRIQGCDEKLKCDEKSLNFWGCNKNFGPSYFSLQFRGRSVLVCIFTGSFVSCSNFSENLSGKRYNRRHMNNRSFAWLKWAKLPFTLYKNTRQTINKLMEKKAHDKWEESWQLISSSWGLGFERKNLAVTKQYNLLSKWRWKRPMFHKIFICF